MNIAFIDLAQQQARIRNKIDAGLTAVLNHGAYIMGPEVGVLENRLGEWTKTTHVIVLPYIKDLFCFSKSKELSMFILVQFSNIIEHILTF